MMTYLKILKMTAVILCLALTAAWGLPSQESTPQDVQKIEQNAQKKTEEEKTEEQKDEDWMTKRMKESESMFEILGIEEVMPTTFDLILIWLLPVIVIVGIVTLILILTKRRHQRAMVMIEKGAYKEAEITKYLPKPYNWRLISALVGLVLVLGGIGLSLFMIGEYGIQKWHMGVIPLLIGLAFLIFNQAYYKKKE